jgi:high-affinity nickel permease
MLKEIATSYQHVSDSRLRPRIVAVYTFLVALNVAVWALALALFWNYPATLSLCLLAYGFGLRHAVDADHIAAIDNATRKLMQEDKRPVTVGFYFSLGHSTVVILRAFGKNKLMRSKSAHIRRYSPDAGTLLEFRRCGRVGAVVVREHVARRSFVPQTNGIYPGRYHARYCVWPIPG